jgi:hypothetical protein
VARPGRRGRSRPLFFRSIETDPTYADAYVHLGNIAWRKGDWKQANTLYRKALDLAEPDVNDIPKGGFWGISLGHASDSLITTKWAGKVAAKICKAFQN